MPNISKKNGGGLPNDGVRADNCIWETTLVIDRYYK